GLEDPFEVAVFCANRTRMKRRYVNQDSPCRWWANRESIGPSTARATCCSAVVTNAKGHFDVSPTSDLQHVKTSNTHRSVSVTTGSTRICASGRLPYQRWGAAAC